MTIFEALREDHETQRSLVDLLIDTTGDSDERDVLFEKIKVELKAHAAAEERCFYVPLFDYAMTQEKSRHSVAEHHEIDELIKSLKETDYSSPGWLVEAKKLQHKVHHHLDEEEHEVFQMAGKVLSDEMKTSLASDYKSEMASQKKKDW